MVLPLRIGVVLGFCGFILLFSHDCFSQQFPGHDSNYYKNYPTMLTSRFYSSKKYTTIFLEGSEGKRTLKYFPNTPVTIGIGATYRILSLNLGFGLQFLNPNRYEKGTTKYLDMQSHLYAENWVVDFFGQFYKGYYLSPRGYALSGNDYYLRPDIDIDMLGVSVYRLTNGKRFSFRAAFVQNEWQKKSAGSFLYGGEIYAGVIHGDSALVPSALKDDYAQKDVYKNRFLEVGPGIGYAYTLVVKEHFFATASLTVSGDIGIVEEYTALGKKERTSLTANASIRSVIGYNSDKWIATISWVNTNTNLRGYSSNDRYLIRTGNVRATVAKRFSPGNRLKKRLKIVESIPIKQPD